MGVTDIVVLGVIVTVGVTDGDTGEGVIDGDTDIEGVIDGDTDIEGVIDGVIDGVVTVGVFVGVTVGVFVGVTTIEPDGVTVIEGVLVGVDVTDELTDGVGVTISESQTKMYSLVTTSQTK